MSTHIDLIVKEWPDTRIHAKKHTPKNTGKEKKSGKQNKNTKTRKNKGGKEKRKREAKYWEGKTERKQMEW